MLGEVGIYDGMHNKKKKKSLTQLIMVQLIRAGTISSVFILRVLSS